MGGCELEHGDAAEDEHQDDGCHRPAALAVDVAATKKAGHLVHDGVDGHGACRCEEVSKSSEDPSLILVCGHHALHGRIGDIDAGVEDRGDQVVGEKHVHELCRRREGRGHREHQHVADSEREEEPLDPGLCLADLRVGAVNDVAHDKVGDAVKKLADGDDRGGGCRGGADDVRVVDEEEGADCGVDQISRIVSCAVSEALQEAELYIRILHRCGGVYFVLCLFQCFVLSSDLFTFMISCYALSTGYQPKSAHLPRSQASQPIQPVSFTVSVRSL